MKRATFQTISQSGLAGGSADETFGALSATCFRNRGAVFVIRWLHQSLSAKTQQIPDAIRNLNNPAVIVKYRRGQTQHFANHEPRWVVREAEGGMSLYQNTIMAGSSGPAGRPSGFPFQGTVKHPRFKLPDVARRPATAEAYVGYEDPPAWRSLMNRSLIGDKRAFAQLLQEFEICLEIYFSQRNTDEVALRLVEETLVSVNEKRRTWDITKSVLGWLLAIADYRAEHPLQSSLQ
ncbi:hypothetical protein [Erythrobacter rubeus]|uniref:Uncharacterized protein n=1 Tax=Erythrobacter rubeus TaxID=2760803 RepID=A0ABR8KY76_9SPHN|nr:hypothetical protein [Erythrobacter rubeus]MBD2843176.1 hypothetical protein [Erythrobacter rubeus]